MRALRRGRGVLCRNINAIATVERMSRKNHARQCSHSVRRHRSVGSWSFYQPPSLGLNRPSDVHGRPLSSSVYKRNGKWVQRLCVVPQTVGEEQEPDASRLEELHRRLSKEIENYRAANAFSTSDLRIIEGVASFESLATMSVATGVSRQAVLQRIERLRHRAPRVWLLWKYKRRFRV